MLSNSLIKPSNAIFQKTTVPVDQLLKQRYQRWITEGKSEPLMSLLAAYAKGIKNVLNVHYIIEALIEIHSKSSVENY